MAMPAYPTEAADFLAQLNSDPYDAGSNPYGLAAGGHRQLFPESQDALVALAQFVNLAGIDIDELAAQVAADAASAAAGSGTEASESDIRSGQSAHYLSIRRAYAAGAFVPLTDAASIAWDMAAGINFAVTIAAAGRTLANPTNAVEGKSGILAVKQDATGGRSITTWGNNFVWVGDQPVWPTAPNSEALISYIVRSSGKIYLNFGGSTA